MAKDFFNVDRIVEDYGNKIAVGLSETIDYQTKQLLERHGFLSSADAQSQGYDIAIFVQPDGTVQIKLCKEVGLVIVKTSFKVTASN